MGGGEPWVYVDQARMTPAMAYDFRQMRSAFKRDTGCVLQASSGIRTDAEQTKIWNERMVPSNRVNGRRVYEWRWWLGILWARISPAGPVAQPGSSNHQVNVSAGRYGAVDVRDSCSSPGVTSFGNVRHRWMVDNGPKYGFSSDEGNRIGEAWHKRYTRDPFRNVPGSGAGGGNTTPPVVVPEPIEEEEMSQSQERGVLYLAPDGVPRTQQKQYLYIHNTSSGFEFEVSSSVGNEISPESRRDWAAIYDLPSVRDVSLAAVREIKAGMTKIQG